MTLIQQIQERLQEKSLLYIQVKVIPKSPITEIMDIMDDGTYKIRVAAPAEGGKANKELVRFLKKVLGAAEVIIVSGKTERLKLIKLR